MRPTHLLLFAGMLLLFSGCGLFFDQNDTTRNSVVLDESRIIETDGNSGKLFDILTASSTGLNFLNIIPDNYENNYWRYVFVYNGGSVNIGDFNNDGLPDIFFTGVMVPHKLFLNKGNLQFEDITLASGVTKMGYEWTSGSTVADVNGDGWLDIYICNTRTENPEHRRNKLFINNGDLTFTEMGKQYGLDDAATCSTANFFDYDNDGDLDMYLVTHPMDFINKFKTVYFQKIELHENLSDKLYRNNGDGTFTDVHEAAGINNHGFGLSCSVGDINDDGFIDIYVANDFGMYDFLYVNNGDGTFKDESLTAIKRHDVSSMGTDIADYNNDGFLDVINADIEMEDNYTYKTFQISTQIEVLRALINSGYGYQKHGNSLKLNNGNGSFSEASRTANVGVTDWGWSPFFSDFDNDGLKDLFMSTGYLQDFNIDETETYSKLRRACRINDSTVYYQLINSIPKNVLNHPNYIYKNNGDLTFTDMRDEWGTYFPSVSYGAAAADFDLDGDLDIICSNANDNPFLYKNNASKNTQSNYLKIALKGYDKNNYGIGTKIKIYCGDQMQYIQHTNVRGYISTTDNIIHFGLGDYKQVDKIEIIWPDGKQQLANNIKANQLITISHVDAIENILPKKANTTKWFTNISSNSGANYVHVENDYDDFRREFLLPHKMSVGGPAIAVGDIDGNGLDDIYYGGTSQKPGALYLQEQPQSFILASKQLHLNQSQLTDDAGALIFDADGDGDNDIYIASGGNEQKANANAYFDRLFLNNGKGEFTLSTNNIPQIPVSKSCVIGCDYDKDGDIDLFIGGRQLPGQYLQSVSSFILRNDKGKFTDVSKTIAPELTNLGMVTTAIWTDFDNDNAMDLMVCGDWMPITFFKNINGKFTIVNNKSNLKQTDGWWQSITGSDLDNDGDIDYIIGNFGTNRRYMNTISSRTGLNLPMEGFISDFDNSGSQDLVLAYYQHDSLYPIQLRERLLEQIPTLRKLVPTWDDYGKATVHDLFSSSLKNATHKYAYEFRSVVLINEGNLQFKLQPLPVEAQLSVVMGVAVTDLNNDGIDDIICNGNYYQTDILIMRNDASTGLVLLGKGDGTYIPKRSYESGFWSEGDTRSLGWVSAGDKFAPSLIGTCNSGESVVYIVADCLSVPLHNDEIYALINYKNGQTGKKESYTGSGYLSQSSRCIILTPAIRSITIYNINGSSRTVINSHAPL